MNKLYKDSGSSMNLYMYTYKYLYIGVFRKYSTIINILKTVCAALMLLGNQSKGTALCMHEQTLLYGGYSVSSEMQMSELMYCVSYLS